MPSQPTESPDDIVIEISNVWKIFGDQADQALKAIRGRRPHQVTGTRDLQRRSGCR